MVEKKFVELQNGVVVEIRIEAGRWKYLVAGSEKYGEWDATLIPPSDEDGWTVRGRNPEPETKDLVIDLMGQGYGLEYSAAEALAMGYMVTRHDCFDFHDGKPYSRMSIANDGIYGEALPESTSKRELFVTPDRVGGWMATCSTTYWDEQYRCFMMKPLDFVIGSGRGWTRGEALRQGLHWLVNASIVGPD